MSDVARAWLDTLDDRDRMPSALRSVAAKAAAGDGLATAACPAPERQWVVLHASPLDISPFTVQDHLKAVFAKVGVQSRAGLVATLYVRHYEPHRWATPSPYGWYLDDNVTAV